MNCTKLALAAGLAVMGFGTTGNATIIVGGPATASPFSPTLANGNFEADSGSPLTFSAVTNWHNIEGDDASVNLGNTGGMGASPEVNSQGAFVFGQMAGNDVGHTVATAGEVFDIDFYGNRFGGGYAGDEGYEIKLFTTTAGSVDASTGTGDITVLSTTAFAILQGWNNYTQDGIYTTTAADVGQTIFLGVDWDNGAAGTHFPRIDVITWEVTPVPEPASFALVSLGALTILRRRR